MSHRPICRLLRLEDRLTPAIATWDGGGANNNWTTAANWVGDVAPQPGDDVVFPAGVNQTAATNDFTADTAFNSLAVNESGYTIGGNAVTLTAGVTADFGPLPTRFESELTLPLAGSGGLTKAGTGRLTLAAANSYTGPTTVGEGVLLVRTATGLGAAGPGNGTTVMTGASLGFDTDGLTVAETLTAAAGALGGESFFFVGGLTTRITLTAPVVLAADARFSGESSTSLTFAGGVSEVGGAHSFALDVGTANFPAGTTVAVTGPTTVNGTALFNGAGPTGVIRAGNTGRIGGTGSVGPLQFTAANQISPGSPFENFVVGTLTTTGLSSVNTRFRFDLAATTDRLVVNGPVQLGGDATLASSDFVLVLGQHYRLIDNDGSDPIVGSFPSLPEGHVFISTGVVNLRITYHGGDGNDFELVGVPEADTPRFAVGAGAGGVPLVNVYGSNGNLVRSFLAYDASFHGGVNVVLGDVTNDGTPDIVTAPGFGGGPVVRVWDGITGALVREFLAYDAAFRGGVNLATDFVDVVPGADIITGPGPGGGPHVKVFAGASATLMREFFAYDANFRGGVSVAAGLGQIITGAGVGGGPHVRIFDARTGQAAGPGFFAYSASFTGGINVSYNANRRFILVAPKAGGVPLVRGFTDDGVIRFEYFAYDAAFRGGVSLALAFLTDGVFPTIVTGPASGGGPVVRQWSETGTTLLREFNAFDPAFLGGVSVG